MICSLPAYVIEDRLVMMNLFSSCPLSAGNFAEAESLYREALSIDEEAHGYRHPEVASCLNSLAALLQVRQQVVHAQEV